jgi:hypothetical protein
MKSVGDAPTIDFESSEYEKPMSDFSLSPPLFRTAYLRKSRPNSKELQKNCTTRNINSNRIIQKIVIILLKICERYSYISEHFYPTYPSERLHFMREPLSCTDGTWQGATLYITLPAAK